MPRHARRPSSTEIYHVILRGINHQQIFEDDEDYRYFLNCIRKFKKQSGSTIFAYCLMGNHIHMLLKEGTKMPLWLFLKKIENSFVYWYNDKYERIGSLFLGRYKSEPVEDKAYFLTVFSYIHMNPVAAGICSTPEEYQYSSFPAYLGFDDHITDTKKIISGFDSSYDMRDFVVNAKTVDCMDIHDDVWQKQKSAHVTSLFKEITGMDSASEFQKLSSSERNHYISVLRFAGISVNQINRHTGVSRALIYKILQEENKWGQVTPEPVP